MEDKAKAINQYIKERHTQEECIGFIAGYEVLEQRVKDLSEENNKLYERKEDLKHFNILMKRDLQKQGDEIDSLKEELESLKKERDILLKQNIAFPRLLGEFVGTLKGLLLWDIPLKLKDILRAKLSELESNIPKENNL
jgi:hypothetical protein